MKFRENSVEVSIEGLDQADRMMDLCNYKLINRKYILPPKNMGIFTKKKKIACHHTLPIFCLDPVILVLYYLYQNLEDALSWACVRIIIIFVNMLANLEKYPVML